MTHEQVVPMIRAATREVFSTMLGIELLDRADSQGVSAPGTQEGVLALVGLAGQWAGSGIFSCSSAMGRRIAGHLLMQEYQSIDDEVLDAIGEVTNMVLGNVKTSLEDELGPMGLSIPTVIYGRNFTTRSVGKSQWSVVPFECLGEEVSVYLCLAPSRDSGASGTHNHHHLSSMLTMLD
ncbi:MAG: chemotaxis protein CheX [Acidobacteria bacterium]|nr:chemotaxis protein CheX [Acidobacteriota bacterium]